MSNMPPGVEPPNHRTFNCGEGPHDCKDHHGCKHHDCRACNPRNFCTNCTELWEFCSCGGATED